MKTEIKRAFTVFFLGISCSFLSARVIRVGSIDQLHYLPKYAPSVSVNYYTEYLNKITEKNGWTYETVQLKYKDALDRLKDGSIDLLYGIPFTDDRSHDGFLFSKAPCAFEYGLLVTNRHDDRFYNGDISSINNSRIGLLIENPLQERILDAFIEKNGLHVKKVYYFDNDVMINGLRHKSLDFRMTFAMASHPDEKIIYNFGMHPVFFMCHDPSVKRELDAAMDELSRENPFYQIDLAMENNPVRTLDFKNITPGELDYIRHHRPISVFTSSDNYPFSYFDKSTGKYRGLNRPFWDELTYISNLALSFHPHHGRQQTLPSSGIFAYVDTEEGRAAGLKFTIPFRTMPVRVICAPGTSVSDITLSGNTRMMSPKMQLAITEDISKLLPYFRKVFIPFQVHFFQSPQECLEQVAKKKCDAALVQDFYLQKTYNINEYSPLRDQIPVTYEVPVSIAVREKGQDILVSILNKTLHQIPYNFFEQAEEQAGIGTEFIPAKSVLYRRWAVMFFSVIFAILLYIVFYSNYSARKYKKKAETDMLTGLWNMNCFEKKCEKLIELSPKSNFMFTELNIRGFTLINRMYGSVWGDKILVFIADRLRQLQSEYRNLYIARGYADNFYMLYEVNGPKDSVLAHFTEKLQPLRKKFLDAGFQVVIKTGTVFSGYDYGGIESIKNLVGKAGYARKYIRNSVIDNFAVFNDTLQEQLALEEKIESCMDKALANDEFYVVYQPKVNLFTDKIEGAEALVRWNSPENGMLPPNVFIPVLEKNGYATKMDFYVYRSVFNYIQQQLDANRPIVPISLNISRLHLNAESFVLNFGELYSLYSIPAQYVELEIVERGAGVNDKLLKDMTDMLHRYGFSVAMDDFGAGESSLNMLSEIPVDVIKFDQRFLEKAENSDESRIILTEMIKMVKMLHKKTVCEGVENDSQVTFLKKIGCDIAQGYYFSHPLLPADFMSYVQKHI